MWSAIPAPDRERRGELGTDQAVIDDKHFFVRGRIEIPVRDTEEMFAWLVWTEVSADDFLQINDLWTVKGRENKAIPCSGRLANELPLYSNTTLGLQIKLHTRPVGERPFVEIVEDHQLRKEQKEGILAHQVQEIAEKLLNG